MRKPLEHTRRTRTDAGVTLVELMMTIAIFGIVLIVINNVFFSTNRLYGNTTARAGQQMNARAGLSLMMSELRTVGCDPLERGLAAFTAAAGDSVSAQSDYDGSGAINGGVEPSEAVTYYYDAAQQAVLRDPGTGPQIVMTNVTGFVLTYFDANNQPIAAPVGQNQLGLIRSVGIAITTQTDRGGSVTADSRVAVRNG
jgi:prepilin-type N-terminal cleavage/methylation domain-containing protein